MFQEDYEDEDEDSDFDDVEKYISNNMEWIIWDQWLSELFKNMKQKEDYDWYYSDILNTLDPKEQYFLFLGKNIDNESLWKNKYVISEHINSIYKRHISANSKHFLEQPTYYKGLFDILN